MPHQLVVFTNGIIFCGGYYNGNYHVLKYQR